MKSEFDRSRRSCMRRSRAWGRSTVLLVCASASLFKGALAQIIIDDGKLRDTRRNVIVGEIPGESSSEVLRGFALPSGSVAILSSIFPQGGWPVSVPGAIFANPAVADLDGDGDLEVVFQAQDNLLRALHHDGTPVAGWPQPAGVFPSAAIADIDHNGLPEVFIGAGNKMKGFSFNGLFLPGWPQMIEHFFFAAAAIDDIDADGDLEIAAGTIDLGFMHVWEHTGEQRPGWPQRLLTPFQAIVAGAALGDLTGDSALEVVVPSSDRYLYAWDQRGNSLPGFPKFIGANLFGEVALADFDSDGELEIAFGTGPADSDRLGRVYVLNPDGSPVPGWPQVVISNINGGVATGDIDEDGKLEIVAATTNAGWEDFQGRVWAWNGEDGTLLPGWPQPTTSPSFSGISSSPVLGDLNGDRRPDILVAGLVSLGATGVWAWNADGTPIEGFPLFIAGSINANSTPTITDLDRDGDVEIGFGTEHPASVFLPGKMFFFDLPAPYDPSTMEWPTLSHDVQRTGRYSPPPKRRIPFDVILHQPFFNLEQPPGVLVAELSFAEDPTGPFAVIAVDGIQIGPIQASEPSVLLPGRPGWSLVRFDGAALARAILQARPDAEEVVLTLHALKGVRAELVGEILLQVR